MGTGGFAPHPGHEPHLHPTLSAIQILAMQDSLHLLDVDAIVKCTSCLSALSRARTDGSIPQTSSPSNLRQAHSQATNGERRTLDSPTVLSRLSRSSVDWMRWIES
jgi:prenyltransferase beta subunit